MKKSLFVAVLLPVLGWLPAAVQGPSCDCPIQNDGTTTQTSASCSIAGILTPCFTLSIVGASQSNILGHCVVTGQCAASACKFADPKISVTIAGCAATGCGTATAVKWERWNPGVTTASATGTQAVGTTAVYETGASEAACGTGTKDTFFRFLKSNTQIAFEWRNRRNCGQCEASIPPGG